MNLSYQEKINNSNKLDCFLNDKLIGEAYDFGSPLKKKPNYIIYINENNLNDILEYEIKDLPTNIDNIHFPFSINKEYDSSWIKGYKNVSINFFECDKVHFFKKNNNLSISIQVQADMDNWEKPFSVSKFADKFEKNCAQYDDVNFMTFKNDELIYDGLGITLNFTNDSENIKFLYNRIISLFAEIAERTFKELLIETKQNSITSVFNFPEEVKEICEQYLVYFSKFLEDLGIKASTSIEQQSQSVLFMVVPNDPSQALGQIRDALNIYLSLPEINDLEKFSNDFTDIGVRQLISNIYHLKSQLMLSQSIIQAKNATIESLNFTNYQQKLLLNNKAAEVKNEEKILDDLITINELEVKGFKINLPKLFRLIKRKFK